MEQVGDVYEEAVARVRAAGQVGVSGEGGLLGRACPLAFLLLATREDVFMFDVERMGEEGWQYGLRTVLQDSKLVKILHDCRQLSDCLWHQHNVRLAGVYGITAENMVYILI